MIILCFNLDQVLLQELSSKARVYNLQFQTAEFSDDIDLSLKALSPNFLFVDFTKSTEEHSNKIKEWFKESRPIIPCIGLEHFSDGMAGFLELKEQLKITYVIEKPLQESQMESLFEALTQPPCSIEPRFEELFINYDKTINEKENLLCLEYKKFRSNPCRDTIASFRHEVHKIAGSAGSYGYNVTGNLCKNLQDELDLLSSTEVVLNPQNCNFDDYIKKICFYFQFRKGEFSAKSIKPSATSSEVQAPIFIVDDLPIKSSLQEKFPILVEVDPLRAHNKLQDLDFHPAALVVRQVYHSHNVTGQMLVNALKFKQPDLKFSSVLLLEEDDISSRLYFQGKFDYITSINNIENDLEKIINAISTSKKPQHHLRALIVDDDPSVTSFLDGILQAENLDTRILPTGDDLFNCLVNFNPNILFLDLDLPNYSGNILLQILRKDIKYKNLAVVIITAEKSKERLNDVCSSSINGVIIKPLTKDKILSVVDHFLNKTTSVTPEDIIKVLKGETPSQAMKDFSVQMQQSQISENVQLESREVVDLTNKDIVIVDDDTDVLQFVKSVFNTFGFNVYCFENGTSGLNFLLRCRDLQACCMVVLDLDMPDIDGMTILKKLKQKFTAIRVVFLSAYYKPEIVVEAKQAGAFDFIKKPFSSRVMRQILRLK